MRCAAFPSSLLVGLMSIACSSCLSAPPNPANPVVIPNDFLGIAHAGYSCSKAEYDLLSMLGARFTRIDFRWDAIEPRKGEYDFSRYDAIVDAAVRNDFGVLAILDYDVSWIHPDSKLHGTIPPGRLDDWLDFVAAVVQRYQGRIAAYEIWNEPNWFFWKGSAEEFASLTAETAAVIRNSDAHARIIAGAFHRTPRRFARIMMENGAFMQVDTISFHPYASTAEKAAALTARFSRYLSSLGFAGGFWITEVGFSTRGIYPNTVSEHALPSAVVKTITLLALSGSQRLVWYALTDKYQANESPTEGFIRVAEAYFGLAYPDYAPKNAAYAYAAIAGVIQGSTYLPAAVNSTAAREGVHLYPFLKNDRRLGLVLWADSVVTITFSESLDGEFLPIDRPGTIPFHEGSMTLSPTPRIFVSRDPFPESMRLQVFTDR
jgi:hypothetical protein